MAQYNSMRSLSEISIEDNSSEYLLADYFGQALRDPYEEDEDLVETNYHKWPVEKLYLEFGSSVEGLTSVQAKYNRRKYGINHVPSPLSAPAWLCCLLPCIYSTPIMEKYKELVPEHAMVLRNGDWLKMDSESLVPGDIIEIQTGERIPADIRIIEMDTCILNPDGIIASKPIRVDPFDSTVEFMGSPNVGLLGFKVTSGSCQGIVVATGKRSTLGRLIRSRKWNPK